MTKSILKLCVASLCLAAVADHAVASAPESRKMTIALLEVPSTQGDAFAVIDDGGLIELRVAADGSLISKRSLDGFDISAAHALESGEGKIVVLGTPNAAETAAADQSLVILTLNGDALEIESRCNVNVLGQCTSYFSGKRMISLCPRCICVDDEAQPELLAYADLTDLISVDIKKYVFPDDVAAVGSAVHLKGEEMAAAVQTKNANEREDGNQIIFFNTALKDEIIRVPLTLKGSAIQCFVSPNGEQVVAMSQSGASFVDIATKQVARQIEWDKPMEGRGEAVLDSLLIRCNKAIDVIDSFTGKVVAALAEDNSARIDRAKAELTAGGELLDFGSLLFLARMDVGRVLVLEKGAKLVAITGDGHCYIWTGVDGQLPESIERIKIQCFE